jgi:hypothetical protein
MRDFVDLASLRANAELPGIMQTLDADLFKDAAWVRSSRVSSHAITIRIPLPDNVRRVGPMPQVEFGLSAPVTQEQFLHEMFHGDTWRNPQEAAGLACYFGATSPSVAQCAVNVLDAGGRGAHNASLYLVCWSAHSVYIAWEVGAHGEMRAAIIPADWRYIVRVANIDVKRADTDLAEVMSRALVRVPSRADRAAFYVGEDVGDLVKSQLGDVVDFRTVPVRRLAVLRCGEDVVGAKAA